VEGCLVGAVGGIDAALEPDEVLVGQLKGVAERRVLIEVKGVGHGPFPELGVGFGQTAELPLVADEAIDVVALLGGLGTEARDIFGGEGFEIGDIFAANDKGLSVNAGVKGILGRYGLALSGARTGRFLSIEAIGLDLFE
jgi:hypothetical protein